MFDVWPRGERLDAIRESAQRFRSRFATPENRIRAIKTVDLASAGYPLSFAFHGAAKGINPYINILNRLVIVQFDDFEGNLKTLAWEPTIAEGAAEAPFYDQLLKRYGEFLSYKVFATFYNTVEEAIAKCGLTPADIDYVSFDHLHVQDLRLIMGTTRPVQGESEPRKPFFPNAKFLFQRKEVDTFKAPHPMQWAWYVPGGMDDVIEDNLVLLDGDVELGKGVAIVSTPGHTDGNHSLAVNTDDGVWVTSENGVCADSWHPRQSKIPGIRKYAEFFNREVVMNANTLEDSIDQYDSMVKEKAIADPNPRDPRWLNVFPSSEMPAWRRQWPVVPTFTYGGMNYGTITKPASRTAPALLSGGVADGLDVVAVGVEHEGAVVVGVVDLAHARPAVVRRAGLERGGVEGIDGLTILGRERHVHAAVGPPIALGDPEEGELAAKSPHVRSRLHHQLHPEWREGLLVEGLAALVVAHIQTDVVESRFHGTSLSGA